MLERLLILSASLAAMAVPAWAQQQAEQDCAAQISALQQSLADPAGGPQAENARILLQSAQILNQSGKADICLHTVAEARNAIGGTAQTPPGQEQAAVEGSAVQPRMADAAAVHGSEVVNPQGEELGAINRVVLDLPRGRIAYAVIGVGGFLGVGEKTVAVPWTALRPGEKEKTYILDADRARLENAPSIDSEDLQAMADSRVSEAVYAYFGQQPYWQQEQTAAAPPSAIDEAALQQQMNRVDQSLRQLQQQTEQLLQQAQSSAAEAQSPEAQSRDPIPGPQPSERSPDSEPPSVPER